MAGDRNIQVVLTMSPRSNLESTPTASHKFVSLPALCSMYEAYFTKIKCPVMYVMFCANLGGEIKVLLQLCLHHQLAASS